MAKQFQICGKRAIIFIFQHKTKCKSSLCQYWGNIKLKYTVINHKDILNDNAGTGGVVRRIQGGWVLVYKPLNLDDVTVTGMTV